MQEQLFKIYYLFLFACILIGIKGYRRFDSAFRIYIIATILSSISECISYLLYKEDKFEQRNSLYHVYNIVEIIITTVFFLKFIQPGNYKKLLTASIVFWPIMAILNIVFFEPINVLNANFLMLESFGIITMSLYSIYLLVKDDNIPNIFLLPHFWMAVILLVGWSGTFFFWAFIKVLYRNDWPYINIVLNLQIILGILVYAGTAAVLFLYPKMKHLEHR